MQVSDKRGRVRADFGLENALAAHCRNRWRANTVGAIGEEWGLTEGEAKGVLYARASRATINKILRHKRGGFALGLQLLSGVTSTTLEDYVERQFEEARDARAEWERKERQLATLHAGLSSRGGDAR